MEDERCIQASVVLGEADDAAFNRYGAVADAVGRLCGVDSSAFDRFQASVVLGRFVEAEQVKAIADLADENGLQDVADFDMGRQRWVKVGGDGTGVVSEALPAEIAVGLGVSVTTASWLLRDVVELKTRQPWTWAGVQGGVVPMWRARQITQLCSKFDLNLAEARRVDRQVADVLGLVGWGRVMNVAKAAIMKIAPTKVMAYSERLAATRYVRLNTGTDPATTYLDAALDTCDASSFDQVVNRLAAVLKRQGIGASRDERRAKAVGVLSTPKLALQLLSGGKINPNAVAQVYVHMHETTLATGGGVVRVEKLGPVLVSQLGRIVGHKRIRLTPVINTGGIETPVDQYEVPQKIKDTVTIRDRFEVFPYSCREARGCDLDHSAPYQPGIPGQTRPSNLGPLSRRVHRIKTHCGWKLTQLTSGVFEWTTSYGQHFIIGPGGTTRYHDRQ